MEKKNFVSLLFSVVEIVLLLCLIPILKGIR